ncbi:DNA starvation/stationary phase protection protein [Halobacillus shinanisalinarum]|uniref:DNA starvation/stationary phase protection protein n=1 Tax=Halobacillus shinanisalinarum TaxID=2932258 RepID=A0ABY4GV81_9BACI|nr:Dps family protein [Halobacillus shinanisalinarum]UOQ91954.1 DNA starvation/stationary phase protection protein [Halobacillus shinanisalinarum]
MQGTTTKTVIDVLNKQLSNFSVMYVKLHNYHWLVTGGDFYDLHEKFEEFYTETAQYMDDLAERILALNGKPVGTMRDFLQTASITEASRNETPEQMVQNISNDFNTMISEITQGTEVADRENDGPTTDMLNHIRATLEKQNWMLKSFLSKS